jgi:hypothetical protein
VSQNARCKDFAVLNPAFAAYGPDKILAPASVAAAASVAPAAADASAHPAAAACRYTRRPWLQQLQDVVPELAGTTTADGKRATPRFPERPEDVNVRGVRRSCCAVLCAQQLHLLLCGVHVVPYCGQLLLRCNVACLHRWPDTSCPAPALPLAGVVSDVPGLCCS